jgi:hypothetical protein
MGMMRLSGAAEAMPAGTGERTKLNRNGMDRNGMSKNGIGNAAW